jgi:hypothetical protein
MNIKKLFLALVPAVALLAATEARAEKFITRFTFKEITTSTNAPGNIVAATYTTQVEINESAKETGSRPESLEMVFDTEAGQIETVDITNGAVKSVIFVFAGGTTVSSVNGKQQFRQAFLMLPDGPDPIGSAAGPVTLKRDALGNLTNYRWTASFQGGIGTNSEVIVGQFTTGEKFVPGPRERRDR